MNNNLKHREINTKLVHQLIQQQFPHWSDLPIRPVKTSGWDNRTFHLGDHMLVRLPSDAKYASQVAKEQYWLPRLQPKLPLMIPKPIAMGQPSNDYPWQWSIYQWITGDTISNRKIVDLNLFAKNLAVFLKQLQQCETTHAPSAGPDNFHRGGDLRIYDNDTKAALAKLQKTSSTNSLIEIWQTALSSTWQAKPVWIHGDIAVGNLLAENGELKAVIDFGQLAVGDPACDLAMYWTFFSGTSQTIFKQTLNLDEDTWNRARGWVLWKTLCAPVAGTDCQKILNAILLK